MTGFPTCFNALFNRSGTAFARGIFGIAKLPPECSQSAFIPSVDLLGALDNWVTRGIAPETLLATDSLQPPMDARVRCAAIRCFRAIWARAI
ncbi:hypothetical protein BN2476_930025 [Paraburkholderia piptadeniae]|uniref:Uncharacterized protein n=1 Tax=Paraburkholderia piptadeniae TaxID=1701573 RepID=A0A1N7STB5_9BURK|nr:hypothetical protein BN2476_930025 [Paraburkholderia piptadeniae]